MKLSAFVSWLCLTALLIMGATATVMADHVRPYKDASAVIAPPAEDDPRLHPYPGDFSRVWTTHAEVIRLCNIGTGTLACAKRWNWNPTKKYFGRCKVFMPDNLPTDLRRAVNVHEVGHCNGWSHAGQTGTVAALMELEDGSLVWVDVAGLFEDETHVHGEGEE